MLPSCLCVQQWRGWWPNDYSKGAWTKEQDGPAHWVGFLFTGSCNAKCARFIFFTPLYFVCVWNWPWGHCYTHLKQVGQQSSSVHVLLSNRIQLKTVTHKRLPLCRLSVCLSSVKWDQRIYSKGSSEQDEKRKNRYYKKFCGDERTVGPSHPPMPCLPGPKVN